MSKIPTIADVAQRANVSEATVSYVLNGRKGGSRISAATRKRVLAIAEEIGYQPNQAARSLRTHRTHRVILGIPSIGAPIYQFLAQDFTRLAEENGYTALVSMVNSQERMDNLGEQLQQQMADGGIFIHTPTFDTMQFKRLTDADIALVFFSNELEPDGFDVIRRNDAEAQREAMEYLIAKGHRTFGFMGSGHKIPIFTDVLAEYDLEPAMIIDIGSSREKAYYKFRQIAEAENLPSVILCTAGVIAMGVLMAARDMGICVPEELAVIGSGNLPEGQITTPPLTTIGAENLSFENEVNLLFSRLATDTPLAGRIHHRKRKLIIRGST